MIYIALGFTLSIFIVWLIIPKPRKPSRSRWLDGVIWAESVGVDSAHFYLIQDGDIDDCQFFCGVTDYINYATK